MTTTTMATEVLQMELNSLKESRAYVERSRDEAIAKVRDLSIQNQELVLQMKKLALIDTSRLAGIESELKLKKFELERASLLLSESEELKRDLLEDKEKLLQKLDVVKDEYTRLKCESEQKICTLKLKMRDKATRLDVYEKLEEELDKVILQAASFPEGGDTDKLLETFGYGSNIPSSAKRRLQHSISLARKGIELEHRCNQLKISLFQERDERKAVEEELEAIKASLSLSTYPTSELLRLIGRRDAEIRKLKSEITVTRDSEERLKKVVSKMERYKADIEQTVKEFVAASDVQIGKEVGVGQSPPPTLPRRKVTFKSPPSIASVASSKTPLISPRSNISDGLSLAKPLTLSKVPIPKDLTEN